MRFAAATLFLACAALLHAQNSPERVKVKVSCTCRDAVGAQFADQLRSLLAASPHFVETSAERDGAGDNVVLTVVSLDSDVEHPGHSSAISAVYTLGGEYVFDQRLEICGPASVRECATDSLAALDQDISRGVE